MMWYFSILLQSFILGGVNCQYQWRCSDYDSNNDRHDLPIYAEGTNSDIATNNISFVNSGQNQTYIFSSFSGLNCSGTVMAVEYCYSGRASSMRPFFRGTTWPVFALSVLHKNGTTFSMINVTEISTRPTNMLCVRARGINYCCDVMVLEPVQQFRIPASNLAFGITVLNSRAALLQWNSTFSEYVVEQYIHSSSMYLTPGSSFTLMESDKKNQTLKLMHLHIRPDPQMPSSSVSQVLSTPSISQLTSTPPTSQLTNTPPSSQVTSTPPTSQVISTPSTSQLTSTPSTSHLTSQVSNTPSTSKLTSTPPTSQLTSTPPTSQLTSTPPTSQLTNTPPTSQVISTPSTSQLTSTPRNSQLTSTPRNSQLTNTTSISQVISTPPTSQVTSTPPTSQLTSMPPTSQLTSTPPTSQLTSTSSISQLTRTPPTSRMSSISLLLISQTSTPPFVQLHSTSPTTQYAPSIIQPSRTESITQLTNSFFNRLQSSTAINAFNTEHGIGSTNSFSRAHTGIALIAGVVGGLVVMVVMVIIICIPIVIVIVKVRRKQKEWTIAEYKESGNSFSNAIYVGDTTLNCTVDDKYDLENPAYDYADVGQHTRRSISKKEFASHHEGQYEYIETNKVATEPRYSCLNEMEDIYMVPSSDISQLYAHLKGFRTDKLTRDTIKLDKMLGSGQFGEVFMGVWKCTKGDVQVAVKTLKEGCEEQERIKFLQEAAIMSQFKHTNVVTMHGVITSGEPMLLVLEILEKGDLRKYLLSMRADFGNEINSDLKDSELLRYCHQIASGMNYLSRKDFVHRDLAARNILVSKDRICKIADFGMSRDLMDETYYVSQGGIIPVKWTAPEALHYKKYSTASDVWSYGVVMYEIWSIGHKPFEGVSNSKVMEMLDSGYRLPPPPGCPRDLYSIMISCWNLRTDQRPVFSHIYKQLSSPDSELLQILKKAESAVEDEAFKLGADLKCANSLYKDLQMKYMDMNKLHNFDNNDSDDYEIT